MTVLVLRILLVTTLVIMAILALVFLHHRRLPLMEWLGWGLLALAVPAIGPFLVLVIRPGQSR